MKERSTASRTCAELLRRLVGPLEQLDLQKLRAGLQATAATHALAVLVGKLLLFLRLPRTGAHVVVAVHRHPGLDLLQRGEKPRPVHHQVADHGKLRHRPQLDAFRLIFEQVIDQGRLPACRSRPLITIVTCPADLFQAVAIPDHRPTFFPSAVTGDSANVLPGPLSRLCQSSYRRGTRSD